METVSVLIANVNEVMIRCAVEADFRRMLDGCFAKLCDVIKESGKKTGEPQVFKRYSGSS